MRPYGARSSGHLPMPIERVRSMRGRILDLPSDILNAIAHQIHTLDYVPGELVRAQMQINATGRDGGRS